MFPAYAYLSAYDRHKKLVNDYLLLRGSNATALRRDTSRDKTDGDVIRDNHKFLWDESDQPETWGQRLAKRYYDKLFKEYCICDLSQYKHNQVALRWRTEKEVIAGKGQFECANKRCSEKDGLRSWEVNFAYVEQEEKKNALVKLRLCADCSVKLNYKTQRKEVKRNKPVKRLIDTTSQPVESTSQVENKESEAEAEEKSESIWKEKPAESCEKPREQEFEEYLADLFM